MENQVTTITESVTSPETLPVQVVTPEPALEAPAPEVKSPEVVQEVSTEEPTKKKTKKVAKKKTEKVDVKAIVESAVKRMRKPKFSSSDMRELLESQFNLSIDTKKTNHYLYHMKKNKILKKDKENLYYKV